MLKKVFSCFLCFLLVFSGFILNDFSTNKLYAQSIVSNLSAGDSHSLALKSDGTVWSWGYNYYGQLGNNSTTNSSIPVQVNNLTGVTAVSAGSCYSLALKSDGTVWSWGYNYYGQLGNNSTIDSKIPVQVSNLTGIIAISANNSHSLALKNDGTVWAWGYNTKGQLGNNSTVNSSVPVQVKNLTGITAISAGYYHSMAFKSDGTVWAWGDNQFGQLGNGTFTSSNIPIQTSITNVKSISAGSCHSLVLKKDGTVWSFGSNNTYGQLGNNSTGNSKFPVQVSNLNNITEISAGAFHSMALKSDGTVWSWAYNSYGQLGNNSNTDSSIPVKVSNITNVINIYTGMFHSLAIKPDGTILAWGRNNYGQLGNNSTTNSNIPINILTSDIYKPSLSAPNINSFSSTSNSITINWGVIDGATSYELSIDNGSPINIGNIITYTQNSLQSNSSHTYKIRSKNISGETSDWSSSVTVYTTAIQPEKIIINNASERAIKVSIKGSINPVGTQYNFGAFQQENKVTETGFSTNTSASIEGLAPTETYDIKVATKSTNGAVSGFKTLATITVPDKSSTNGDLDVNVIVDPTITLTLNTNSVNFGSVSPLTENYELPSVLVIGIQSNNVYTLSAKVNNDFVGTKGFKMPSSLLNIREHNNSYVSFQNGVKNDLVSNQAPTSGTNYNIDLKLKTDYNIKPDTYSNIINIAVNQI